MREERILEVNYWLKGWCHQENFGFFLTLPRRRVSSKRWATPQRYQQECIWKTTGQAHPKSFKLGLKGEGDQSLRSNPKYNPQDNESDNEKRSEK